MAEIKIISGGKEKIISAENGRNLHEVLTEKGIFLPAVCGGRGVCNKCKVKIIDGIIKGDIEDGYVKSCKADIIGDVTVEISIAEGSGLSKLFKSDYNIKKTDGFGIAVDIGTTTLVLYLVDLERGNIIDIKSELNRQAAFGGDVLSRIKAAEEGNLEHLRDIIRNQINIAIRNFKQKYNIKEIKKTVISGNTTMLHLLYGADPSPIGRVPFEAVFLDTKTMREGIESNETILLPLSSAYIGSDIVIGVLSSGMYENSGKSLLIDIGTNGEMVLKCNDVMTACSTAAGPAFEGGNIEKGMGGSIGAIDKIDYKNGKINCSVIGGVKAQGICGPGLVDIISLLIREGVIDESGYMEKENVKLYDRIRGDRFYITDDIYITQKDIREYQLGKSAIRSGIETLLFDAEITPEELDVVFLAGGFGYYMNVENAIITGLLPEAFTDKIINVGNTSGLGAVMCLLNSDKIKTAEIISGQIKITELSNHPEFIESFIDNMSF